MASIDEPPALPPTTVPRRAESTDTRQAIQHHDPEFYRKKRDEDDQNTPDDPYEDLTDVSVEAVRGFLLDLLNRAEGAPNPQPSPSASAPQNPPPHHAPTNPKAAAAAQAYQSGANMGHTAPPAPPPVQNKAPTSALDAAAATLERRALLDLIRALDRLSAAGVSTISLDKADSFLDSIRLAVEKAQNI